MDANFYRVFEDRHRGTRELIKQRLTFYLPMLRILHHVHPGGRAIDLGCGRGEWLEIVAEAGFKARGVDIDEHMLAPCRELGLCVEIEDALSCLRNLHDESHALVTGFHLAEHLRFEELQDLVRQALRVLKPAGLLILETPNPENLVVGSSNFYSDPTHQRPLPPPLLAFLPDFYGFERTKVVRLQEAYDVHSNARAVQIIDVVAGISPDYAIVAQKHDRPDIVAAFDGVFAADYGVSLAEVAQKYDQRINRIEERMSHGEQYLVELRSMMAAIAAKLDAQLEERGARIRMLDAQLEERGARIRMLEAETATLRDELHGVYHSRSWRITAPLRAVMGCARSVRSALGGLPQQAALWLRNGALRALRPPVRLAMRSPALKRLGARLLATRPGLKVRLLRLTHPGAVVPEHLRFGSPGKPGADLATELPESARDIYRELQARLAISRART